jgi:hypothetical protein
MVTPSGRLLKRRTAFEHLRDFCLGHQDLSAEWALPSTVPTAVPFARAPTRGPAYGAAPVQASLTADFAVPSGERRQPHGASSRSNEWVDPDLALIDVSEKPGDLIL